MRRWVLGPLRVPGPIGGCLLLTPSWIEERVAPFRYERLVGGIRFCLCCWAQASDTCVASPLAAPDARKVGSIIITSGLSRPVCCCDIRGAVQGGSEARCRQGSVGGIQGRLPPMELSRSQVMAGYRCRLRSRGADLARDAVRGCICRVLPSAQHSCF